MADIAASDRQKFTQMRFGFQVEREVAANGTGTYFTVAGGRVIVMGLIGEVTVEAVGATTLVITHVQTTGGTQPVSASLDLDPAVVGSNLGITGLASDAMVYTASAAGVRMCKEPVVLDPGALTFTFGAVSGSTKWKLFYFPLDEGAYVEAA